MSTIADLLNDKGSILQQYPNASGNLLQGAVTDNDDKAHPGMVRVELTAWTDGRNICDWIPLLRSYAGKDYGGWLVPEVGEIVLVGFIGADCKRPVVLGSLYPAGARMASECQKPKNTCRRLRTKGGVDITLSDEKGKESLRAETPGGLTLSLDDEKQSVTLGDRDGKNSLTLSCRDGAVELAADARLTLKSGRCEVTLDGRGGAVKIQCDRLEIKATQNAKLDGGQATDISGGALTVQGRQTAEIKGGAMLALTGGVVKLN